MATGDWYRFADYHVTEYRIKLFVTQLLWKAGDIMTNIFASNEPLPKIKSVIE